MGQLTAVVRPVTCLEHTWPILVDHQLQLSLEDVNPLLAGMTPGLRKACARLELEVHGHHRALPVSSQEEHVDALARRVKASKLVAADDERILGARHREEICDRDTIEPNEPDEAPDGDVVLAVLDEREERGRDPGRLRDVAQRQAALLAKPSQRSADARRLGCWKRLCVGYVQQYLEETLKILKRSSNLPILERTRNPGSADIAVVGGGISGLSVAWHLARRGVAVTIVERAGLGSGATAIQPGGLRRQWGSQVNCLLAAEARTFYADLADRLGVRIDAGFQECGYLFVAHSRDGEEALARNVSLQNACGVPSRMVRPDEASELVPGLDAGSIVAASYCSEDGYFDRPQAVVAAFIDACRAAGVTVVQAAVHRLESCGPGWSLSLRDGGSIETGGVVLAAAWDTPALLEPLGVHVPIKKEPRYLFYSDPIRERLLEPLVVSPEWHLAAKQLADGSVLSSDLSAGADPGEDEAIWRMRLRNGLRRLLPILDYVDYPTVVEGFYDLTPDGLAIVGPVADHQGLWIAAGHSGRGFMLAPAIGRALSEAILDGSVDSLVEALSLERFRRAELTLESQVV